MSNPELAAKLAKAATHMAPHNPASGQEETVQERRRIPLSVPQRKLQVPAIPGYHLRWLRGIGRAQQAIQAGFEFVSPDEVSLNSIGPGGDAQHSGNTDMGSRVSVVEGGEIEGGQAVRMYLMKQKMEFYLEDKQILEKINDKTADNLTAAYRTGTVGIGQPGAPRLDASDAGKQYVDASRTKVPELFKKKLSKTPGQ